MILDETPLFDPGLLKELDWSENTVQFSPPISPSQPGEGLLLRPLCPADLNRGILSRLRLTLFFLLVQRGRIEEVVVSDECRGKQLGKLLVSAMTLLSKKLDCYKITLECLPKNVAFYEKFSYSSSAETYMQHRFFD
ncbi:UNVERIFIED_CONTAM: hypothetical protein FKN15_076406 [Acipenser sinensis]